MSPYALAKDGASVVVGDGEGVTATTMTAVC
jgi:hypothetical protein